MSTTSAGREAEDNVAKLLSKKGHKILAQNWKTKWCEIDIISKYKKVVYFTEVKYRSSDLWGDGLSYITKKKLNQMKFATEFWIAKSNWTGEVQLQVASVDSNQDIELVEI